MNQQPGFDEPGCYHNNNLIAAVKDVDDRVGLSLCVMILLNPQQGHFRQSTLPDKGVNKKRYFAGGHDILNVGDMREALKERPVRGTTAAVGILNESCEKLQTHKIKHFSELHNFCYEESGLRL